MCVVGVVAGSVSLSLSAVRLPGTLAAVSPVPDEANAAIAASVAFSVVAVALGFAMGAVLARMRERSSYTAVSIALALLSLVAGGVVTGTNFWLVDSAQPAGTRVWTLDTSKAAGAGVVLVIAAVMHLILLCTDHRQPATEGVGDIASQYS